MSETHSPFDEPVVLPVGDALDLHPFQPKDIPSVVEEFWRNAGDQESGRFVSFMAKAQAYNARLSDLSSIKIQVSYLSRTLPSTLAVGEPLSQDCWLSKIRLLDIDLCDEVVEDTVPYAWITVDIAVFSAQAAVGPMRVWYGNVDCFGADRVLCLDRLQTSTKCKGCGDVKIKRSLYVVGHRTVRPKALDVNQGVDNDSSSF